MTKNVAQVFLPELLAPAGSLEKLKIAISYGADAVYCAGQRFGLRAAADNFTLDELAEGVSFAHDHRAKVFVVLNGFLHDHDLKDLPQFVSFLQEIKTDAVIASDLGVIKTVQKHTNLPIHLSTQASCLNVQTARLWQKAGVTRIVLGRETSIEEAGKIKRATGLEVELFIHGSMCMAYSGHCVISNYTQGRDSNRGGCSHSCRHEYEITDEQGAKKNSFFMSSKDLRGLELLPYFSHHEIDSLKIEGRMKGPLYAANATRTYRQALDILVKGHWSSVEAQRLEQELEKMAHRSYTAASLESPAGPESVYHDRETEITDYECCGVVVGETEQDLLIEVRSKFLSTDTLELLPFRGPNIFMTELLLRDFHNCPLDSTRPGYVVRLKRPQQLQTASVVGQILRRYSPSMQTLEVQS